MHEKSPEYYNMYYYAWYNMHESSPECYNMHESSPEY